MQVFVVLTTADGLLVIDLIIDMLARSNNKDFKPSIVSIGDNGFVLNDAEIVGDIPEERLQFS